MQESQKITIFVARNAFGSPEMVKPAQEKCGIKTNLTFHKARHYYCRELLNKFKFSYEIAAKCMGHNSTKQTRHYGKVFSSTVFDAFKEIGEGL